LSIPKSLLVFVSAFLLFVVQPMAGKDLLPRWGGSASVWTACLLFFQLCLLLGYCYARLSVRALSVKSQATAQGLLMLGAAVWLFVPWRAPLDVDHPALSVLANLGIALALPAIALSSASPMASHWAGVSEQGREPYALYAISNAGSLLGALAYPFAVEPWLSLPHQQWIWRALFVLLALGWFWACRRIDTVSQPADSGVRAAGSWNASVAALWLALPLSTSIILAASTLNLSQAGVVVPGLWVVPLAIYLVTWWLAFSGWGPSRWGGQVALFYTGAMVAFVLIIFKLWLPWIAIIAGYASVMFCTGLACHGLLYAVRPAAEHLTAYYLAISLGGVMGTAGALLVAPQCFADYYELHIGLSVAALAVSSDHMRQLTPKLSSELWVRRWKWPVNVILPCVLLGGLWTAAWSPSVELTVDQERDFYGVVRVVENNKLGYRAMVLGQTIHGVEPLDGQLDVDQSMYYGSRSGVALAWGTMRERWNRPLRVGAIGLGTGTMSLYASRNDHVVYYEISPAVRDMARKHFRYLDAHQGKTDIRIGDGRMLIAAENESGLATQEPMDLLLIDAFTNDSIPMHLLTVEAIQTYRRRLTDQGWVAINITNRNLDLAPVLFATAREAGYQPLLVENPIDAPRAAESETSSRRDVRWLLCLPPGTTIPAWPAARTALRSEARAWTDAYGSLLQAFRL
jgi:spermidine synthase